MNAIPELATCSYAAYRRDMGTAVRITLGRPRFIKLPDPRYTMSGQWPYISELAPQASYFHDETVSFGEKYLAQIERHAADIEEKLTWIQPEHGRLCLLCFERKVRGPEDCHRRRFAEWWEKRTGRIVHEYDAAP